MENSEMKYLQIFDNDKNCNFLKLSDGKLLTNDGCMFQIHKVILARSSDYFLAMFCGTNKNKAEFTIPGISGEYLSDILCHIYTGNIRVTEENAVDLLMAADYLFLKDLYSEVKINCRSNMITDTNSLKILKAANDIGDKEFEKDCFRFTQTRFEWIMCCEKNGVEDLPFETLETILCNRSLYASSERTVWRAIVEWTQYDLPHRLDCAPRLLLCLAVSEVEEELAEEILQHEIITNDLWKDLNGVKSSNDFTSNLQIFLSLLRNRLLYILEPCYFRIPINVHIVCQGRNLYVTYDENIDLWNKISEFDFLPEFMTVIGHNIYTFEPGEYLDCKNFDLSTMDWVPMEDFRWDFMYSSIVTIDQNIYVTGSNGESYNVVMYDTEINKWFHEGSLNENFDGPATSIEKMIYVVVNQFNSLTMKMYVFDSVTKHWSSLSSPSIYRCNDFELIEYRQRIYLIGGSDEDEDIDKAEVYDPATNLWAELPDIPHLYSLISAKVFNDQLWLHGLGRKYSKDHEREVFLWKFEKERWEQVEDSHPLEFLDSLIYTTYDAETIKLMTKRNRDPKTNLEKTDFTLNN